MTYYFITKSMGRAGCANMSWRIREFASKAELKRAYKGRATIVKIWAEDELPENQKEVFEQRGVRY